MRNCFRCKVDKDEKDFWNGCSYCIQCDKEYRKIWREKNKKEYAERRKILWLRRKFRECKKCGERFVGKGMQREFCSTKCKLLGTIKKLKISKCWEWQGDLHPNGYAYTTKYENRKKSHVHRISYEIFKGEIPKGLYVCHSCDNRKCINPQHLWIGTAKENMQDAKNKGRLKKKK